MDIRKIRAEDWPDVLKLWSVVYNSPRTSFEVSERNTPEIEATWAVFDGGVPISVLTSHRFEMAHDGDYVKMAGIGGIGTLPEHRRRGHVRRLMEVAFRSMREREEAFSLLYPFSFPYYRMFGYELVYSGPGGCDPDADIVSAMRAEGAAITVERDPARAVEAADLVVTDTWVSMHDAPDVRDARHAALGPWRVDAALMARAKPDALFMHCLPAHRGEEVTDEVMDSPASVVFDEAENRLHAQKAILRWCLGV